MIDCIFIKVMNTIALDFDGVLCDNTGWKGRHAGLDGPVTGAIQAIRDYQDSGITVVIHTQRADTPSGVIVISRWLRDHGLEQRRINMINITDRKPAATVYLDDRAILFTGTFPPPEEIKAFKTWKGF
jgi:hypothetical protein